MGGRLRRAHGAPGTTASTSRKGYLRRSAFSVCARHTIALMKATSTGATARCTNAASARPAASRARDATAGVGPNAAPIPIPPAIFRRVTARWKSTTSTATRAEHMNLPLNQSQMSSRGSTTLGYTEMKGSWFIFDTYRAHEDWCRWRAPFWHGTRVMDPHSHANYHLGFRCCNSLKSRDEAQSNGIANRRRTLWIGAARIDATP